MSGRRAVGILILLISAICWIWIISLMPSENESVTARDEKLLALGSISLACWLVLSALAKINMAIDVQREPWRTRLSFIGFTTAILWVFAVTTILIGAGAAATGTNTRPWYQDIPFLFVLLGWPLIDMWDFLFIQIQNEERAELGSSTHRHISER